MTYWFTAFYSCNLPNLNENTNVNINKQRVHNQEHEANDEKKKS